MGIRIITAALLAAGSTVAAHAWQAQPAPRPDALPIAVRETTALPAVQALFDGYVRDKKMPGIVAAIGRGDAAPAFAFAGTLSTDSGAAKAGPDSLWRVYSMTKPITAMAAMMLVEDGKLTLDQPLSSIYPEFKAMRVLTSPDTSLDSVPAKTPITIRMLLTHTAGLSYNISAKGPLLKEYERLGLLPGAINAAVEAQAKLARPSSLQAFATRVAQAPLIAEPGTKWSYSIGLDLTAALVEKVSGMPFERFVQLRLFGPLRMRSSFWQVPASEVGRLADNYAIAGTALVPLDPAGGSVYLRDVPGGASKGTYGWGGAAGTIAWVDPVKKVRGTVMVNYFPADRWPVRADVVHALYAQAWPR